MPEPTFIERVWYERGTMVNLARAALVPLERVYGAIVGTRELLYDAGWLPTHETALPALSVGNLSVGGTGKTPIAAWLARGLEGRGARPAIVLRGYGDDEPQVHRVLNPSLPVIVNADRVAGIAEAARAGATVVVLDDAFQHRRARRRADLVLVSADRWTENTRLLPAGPWREPLHALRRATLIVVTRRVASDATVDAVHQALAAAAGAVPRVSTRLALGDLHLVGGADVQPLQSLAGAQVHVLTAIGDPGSFLRQIEDVGATVVPTIFPDHHRFHEEEIRKFARGIPSRAWAVCTLKDAVKLEDRWPRQGPPVWYVSQLVTVERGVGGVERVLDDLVRMRPRMNPAPSPTPTAG